MKKLILIIVPLLLVSLLAAIEFEYDGENRTRAAFYNDQYERDGGHIDNRLYLGMNANLHPSLMMRVNLQFGDVVWGNTSSWGGKSNWGGLAAAVDVKAYELYVDYRIRMLDSNVRVGQQYWADNMGLILDDSFSGIMFNMDNFIGFQTNLGWIKVNEYDTVADDDYCYFLLNMKTPHPLPWGIFASYGRDNNRDYSTATLMPFVSLDIDPIQIDANVFAGLHFIADPIDDEVGLGAAVKAKVDLGPIGAGADLLFATEKGIEVLSPYYQNGLYIYGYGTHHDGLNLYWNDPYSQNTDTVLSLVGKVNTQIIPRLNFFAAAGYLLDAGMEINGGVEVDLIPELLQLSCFGAVGWHEGNDIPSKADGASNYVLGTSLEVKF